MTMSENIHFIVAACEPPSCSTHVSVILDPFNTAMYGIGVVRFGDTAFSKMKNKQKVKQKQ